MSPQEASLADALNHITHKEFPVYCRPTIQNKAATVEGVAYHSEDGRYRVELTDAICRQVGDYAASRHKAKTNSQERRALLIAAHEAAHVSTESRLDEAETTCVAFQALPELLEGLGASAQQAQEVQLDARSTMMFLIPKKYNTPECYDTGPLDLDEAHAGVFPYQSANQ